MSALIFILIFLYPLTLSFWAYLDRKNRMHTALLLGPIGLIVLTVFTQFMDVDLSVQFFSHTQGLFALGLKWDVLTSLIAITVLTIGGVVYKFSWNYLQDDPFRVRFLQNLSLTLSFVLLMLMAADLIVFLMAWVTVSYFLHKLLLHFPGRDGAVKAAQQKFWISRFGDVVLILGCLILYQVFGSLKFDIIMQSLDNRDLLNANTYLITIASICIVIGAMAKSAQYPLHFWLPNTMETPTPVSALMHAGVINAGGYLIIRMSPLLSSVPLALGILTCFGSLTILFGLIMMWTQTSVKKSLAYSTISQMGFMMVQCGVGAFHMAVVHCIGHAFYKAYAFLSSGTATDFGRLERYYPDTKKPINFMSILWALTLAMFLSWSLIFILNPESLVLKSSLLMYLVVTLAMAQIFLVTRFAYFSVPLGTAFMVLYLSFSFGMQYILKDVIPLTKLKFELLDMVYIIFAASIFVSLFIMQNIFPILAKTDFGKKLYVRALNGRLI